MTSKRKPKSRGKRPYVTPKLVVHGTLRQMTQGKDGDKQDGASKPHTRTSAGGPA